MAKEYKITIENANGEGVKSPIAGSDQPKQAPIQSIAPQSNALPAIKGYIAVKRFVAPFVNQAISHEINLVQLRTGSAELQAKISFGYSITSKAFGIVESIAIGAALGGAAGALIGATVGIAQTVIGYAQAQEVINTNSTIESYSIGFANARAGGSVSSYNRSR